MLLLLWIVVVRMFGMLTHHDVMIEPPPGCLMLLSVSSFSIYLINLMFL